MFGVSTFCLHKEPLASALDRITRITDHVEIMDDGMHYLDSSELLENFSARFTIHAPCRSVNIASLLEPIRRASVEVVGQAFGIARDLGADVVVHPGYFAWAEERPRAEQRFRQSLADLTTIAEEYGIRFFVENMGDWEYFFLKTPDEIPLIGDAGFALDVGHAHQNRCLEQFLTCRIGHFHLHDNDGTGDTHSAVGEGTIDFPKVMDAVRRNHAVPVIEVATFEGVVASIEVLGRM
jgi:sugar phosphate isomerase/epimerase